MRTSNPALNAKTFANLGVVDQTNAMTIQGTTNKAMVLLVLVALPAFYTWNLYFAQAFAAVALLWLGGTVGGLLVAFTLIFKKEWSGILAPAYALAEGLALGGISAFFENSYPGIVLQAVGLTFGICFALLLTYTSRLIRVTENFKLGVTAATFGIFLLYVATFLLGLFGIRVPYIHDSGPYGILVSLGICIIAALNLVLDFDFIEQGAAQGAPKYMEWYGAFGLMVTLIWLYVEILRLLAKLREK